MSVPTQQARSHVASAKGDIRAAQKRVQYVVEGLQTVFGPQRSPGGAQDQLHAALADLSDALVALSRAQDDWYEYCPVCGCNVTDGECSCAAVKPTGEQCVRCLGYFSPNEKKVVTLAGYYCMTCAGFVRDEENEVQERRGQYTCERCGTGEARSTLLFGSWLCDSCIREKMSDTSEDTCPKCGASRMADQTGPASDWCYCDTPGTAASEGAK